MWITKGCSVCHMCACIWRAEGGVWGYSVKEESAGMLDRLALSCASRGQTDYQSMSFKTTELRGRLLLLAVTPRHSGNISKSLQCPIRRGVVSLKETEDVGLCNRFSRCFSLELGLCVHCYPADLEGLTKAIECWMHVG